MTEQKLAAEIRSEFGKGAARRARRNAQIPAVIYGHGAEPLHVLLPKRETTLALRTANALLSLDVDGDEHLVLAKEIQRNPIQQIIEHVDLLTVQKGEKVSVEVNIHVEGEVAPGTVFNLEHPTVSVEAEATHLPETLTINVEGREAGAHVHASDIELPQGVALLVDADTVIATVSAEAAAAEAEGEAAGAAEAAAE
ncbi:50S ribosomal protein L25/general stress protein Ctc [Arthrobacter mobilis]|uniref:Large ribosomal subunit protein bL25 n=1 Tax=Arthrobacter mobilis TaxID=2724944 RepID=A0A7X6K5D6_9MICC|nr:50S ribosomal protein L25/general stress protein Ctc [Arthrobacter mobilis]NKX53318.1 50S ribosomal protein L25/general stress protein Ctc [Arthrobacter mobilis]